MLLAALRDKPAATPPTLPFQVRRSGNKQLYFALLGERGAEPGQIDELARSASRAYLSLKLDEAAALDIDFPADLRSLPAWLDDSHRQTTEGYRRYLDERQAGAPRRFFKTRSHALNFIRAIAPTKLVDGAWLYGALARWQDPRLAPLIRIYLEELGDGLPGLNHVVLYKQLLTRYGCDHWQDQPDGHFVQGAVQLALAHQAVEFMPEIIGFNLGYEQLPLHLPITAYELNELNVDPYYFTLHVTIDNASTGHARKSLQCVLDCIPRLKDSSDFYRRVATGYKLNMIGMGTNEAIAAFDLERELTQVMADKAAIGAQLHSDYCRVGGRAVSDWLSSPGQMPQFLAAMQSAGWIVRSQAPEQSRFWRMLADEQAPMFGVFDGYELQLIHDWIVDDAESRVDAQGASSSPRRAVNRFRQRATEGATDRATEHANEHAAPGLGVATDASMHGATVKAVIARHLALATAESEDEEIQDLAARLDGVHGKSEALALLAGLLSPANHPTPAGLLATRLYADLFAR